MTTDKVKFWDSIRKTAAKVEHDLNLAGKELAHCSSCNGTGQSEPSRSDCDSHGSHWVPGTTCRYCSGRGRVAVPCSKSLQSAAIKREIAWLKTKLKELK